MLYVNSLNYYEIFLYFLNRQSSIVESYKIRIYIGAIRKENCTFFLLEFIHRLRF
jgi:hypothetical protein